MEHHNAVRATVGLNNEGLKSWKKIECEGFMNSFVNTIVIL